MTDQASIDRLVTEHMGYAKRLARRFAYRYRVPKGEREDIEALALAGLVRAARSFDPARGVPFQGFCGARIWGSMLDFTRDEVEINRFAAVCRHEFPEHTGTAIHPSGDDPAELSYAHAESAEEWLARAELRHQVLKLPDRERAVIVWYFFEDGSLAELERETGVLSSRLCQLKSAGLARLKRRLERPPVRRRAA